MGITLPVTPLTEILQQRSDVRQHRDYSINCCTHKIPSQPYSPPTLLDTITYPYPHTKHPHLTLTMPSHPSHTINTLTPHTPQLTLTYLHTPQHPHTYPHTLHTPTHALTHTPNQKHPPLSTLHTHQSHLQTPTHTTHSLTPPTHTHLHTGHLEISI